jgi:glycosyltransferase involved in cell wall biosynthesis
VDISALQSRTKTTLEQRILFVGRLEYVKGVDVLLRAVAQIQSYLGAWQVRIVGDGSARTTLEQLTKDLGLSSMVTFVGFAPVSRVYDEYAEASIFCGLSRSEALGNVFIEAQAAGLPVVATRVGGIVDTVIENETGILVPPDEVTKTAETLLALVQHPETRRRLGENGKVHAAQYDWNGIAAQYAAVYQSLLSEPSTRQ